MDNINIPSVFHQYSINIPLVVTQDYGLLSHSPFLQKPTVVPFRPVARLPSGARHTWRSSRSRQQTMRPQGPQRRQPTTPRILGTSRDGGKAEAKIWVNPHKSPWNPMKSAFKSWWGFTLMNLHLLVLLGKIHGFTGKPPIFHGKIDGKSL